MQQTRNNKFNYSECDYDELEAALMRAESVSHGRPDQYQYYQNELSRHLAYFLLKPYKMSKLKKDDSDE